MIDDSTRALLDSLGGVEAAPGSLAGVVVAQIQSSAPHPNADKLSVTQVDAGRGAPLQIVCAAKNYKVGDKVPLATIGTTLPNGVEIKQAALRGCKLITIDLKVGDRVLFGKWSGTEVKLDGQELLIMKESDIMGVLTDVPAAKKKAA